MATDDHFIVWLEKEAAQAQERINSIELRGLRWLQIGKESSQADVTEAVLTEAKERLSESEAQLARLRSKHSA